MTAHPRAKRIAKYITLGLLGALTLVLAIIGLQSVTRGSPLQRVLAVGDERGLPAPGDPLFRRSSELIAKTEFTQGNQIRVATNGDQTYPQLWADLRAARQSITLQFYYMNPGRMADTLKLILIERAQAGVKVFLLYDAFGAGPVKTEWFDSLRAGGVKAAVFRPVHWYQLNKAQTRSHVRAIVIDGAIGYTGGFGIDDKWFGDGRHKDQWRDSNVRFLGPAVMALQATFIAGWSEATGSLLAGDYLFPPDGFHADGTMLASLMHATPTIGSTQAERFLALTIASARRTLYISNSYFVPDDDFRRLLVAAARRGVDVRVITTSKETDVRWTWYAGRWRYDELLSGGVKLYEYRPVMMHAKTLVADGVWSSVGTMNFDNRSMVFNDEANLLVLDRAFGAQMDSIFMEDLKYCNEIRLPAWRERGAFERVMEWGSTLFSRLL